jgi:hypothetical protein
MTSERRSAPWGRVAEAYRVAPMDGDSYPDPSGAILHRETRLAPRVLGIGAVGHAAPGAGGGAARVRFDLERRGLCPSRGRSLTAGWPRSMRRLRRRCSRRGLGGTGPSGQGSERLRRRAVQHGADGRGRGGSGGTRQPHRRSPAGMEGGGRGRAQSPACSRSRRSGRWLRRSFSPSPARPQMTSKLAKLCPSSWLWPTTRWRRS